MLKVQTVRHPLEGRIIEALLESNGIPVEIRGEALYGTVDGGTFAPNMLPTIWVINDSQAAQAEELLSSFFKDPDKFRSTETWICSNCGETHESQFAACWQCDTPKPSPEHA